MQHRFVNNEKSTLYIWVVVSNAKVHEGASCSRRGGFGCLCGSLQGHLFVSWWNENQLIASAVPRLFTSGPSLDDGMVYLCMMLYFCIVFQWAISLSSMPAQ